MTETGLAIKKRTATKTQKSYRTRMGTKGDDRTPLTHVVYPSSWIEQRVFLTFDRDNRTCEMGIQIELCMKIKAQKITAPWDGEKGRDKKGEHFLTQSHHCEKGEEPIKKSFFVLFSPFLVKILYPNEIWPETITLSFFSFLIKSLHPKGFLGLWLKTPISCCALILTKIFWINKNLVQNCHDLQSPKFKANSIWLIKPEELRKCSHRSKSQPFCHSLQNPPNNPKKWKNILELTHIWRVSTQIQT